MSVKMLFDDRAAAYDAWFDTPMGRAILKYESELVIDLLRARPGDHILDAGCGTGVFTRDMLAARSAVTGLDISLPMLCGARRKFASRNFKAVRGDILSLPFADESFDKVASITALEFIADGARAVAEFFRVTRAGGRVVIATLNSLSSWAARRLEEPQKGEEDLWASAVFRSPDDLLALSPCPGTARTAVHFDQDVDPILAVEIERRGRTRGLRTGAFVAACWEKP